MYNNVSIPVVNVCEDGQRLVEAGLHINLVSDSERDYDSDPMDLDDDADNSATADEPAAAEPQAVAATPVAAAVPATTELLTVAAAPIAAATPAVVRPRPSLVGWPGGTRM